MAEILLKDVMGVLGALSFEVNKKGRSVRFLSGKTTDETIIARSQRQAWRIYRDGPLRDRFRAGNGQRWGFSRRSLEYAGNERFRQDPRTGKPGRNVPGTQGKIRKGSLPDYVFTGKFRNQLEKRNPKRVNKPGDIATKFSIFGGVMNVLGSQHGRIGEIVSQERRMVMRSAHVRRDSRSGRNVSVRAYQQMGVRTKRTFSRAPKSYAEEWSYTPKELQGVQQDVDRLTLDGFRTAIYDQRTGTIKGSIRERMRGA